MEARSLAADLTLLDIDDRAALTDYLATYCVAPCRRMWSRPEPHAQEGDAFGRGDLVLEPSTAHFEPVIVALALWAGLFPQSAPSFGNSGDIARNPASAWLDGSFFMAAFTSYEEIGRQVDGLFAPEPNRAGPNWAEHEPWPNPEAVAELRTIRELILRLVGPPREWGDLEVIEDTGLEHVDIAAARELDTILRGDVHRRLVRFGADEPILPEESPDGEAHILTVNAGVFPALVPESISGAIALDYTEGLARHRRVAVCGHCNRAVVLSNQRAARARKALPVYHQECAHEHRLGYYRGYQRQRRGGHA